MLNQSGKYPIEVLVVEDDPEFASMLEAILSEATSGQFNPVLVETLEGTLIRLQKQDFDVILLDLFLPDCQGQQTFRKIIEVVPEVPIVVVTGMDDKSQAIQSVREGAQDYLVKGDLDVNQLIRSLLYAIERHRSRRVLQDLSFSDELTGLLNRRGFLSLAPKHLKIAQRANWELLVFFIDLDELKKINDNFGHPEGDQALRAVANILRETFRTSDVVARIGGDEFIVLAINASDASIENITARLHENMDQHNHSGDRFRISLSYGVARFGPQEQPSLEEMIIQADQALYDNKRRKHETNQGP
ncbi:MAG TPA: GGDEF domain-containing response regulator [Anaerolineales bacterium]|nr:GGDEF domain-containing response regulator [Anaerolineales bacterium]